MVFVFTPSLVSVVDDLQQEKYDAFHGVSHYPQPWFRNRSLLGVYCSCEEWTCMGGVRDEEPKCLKDLAIGRRNCRRTME